ncbi:MAG: hypothetical protein Q8R28_14925 [Dehalococcoidia bacterium]|nr:hypothetical protein [Dehalococcoidia bacterium]
MAEASVADTDVERERKQLEEIEACLDTLQKLQHLFLRETTRDDLNLAKGRKCILGVTNLKYHKYETFFEVTPAGVTVVKPYNNPNTYVGAPLASVLRVLKGTLAGDPSAFGAEWARGNARLVGERRIHDGHVFSSIFRDLAHMIARYRSV